MLVFFRVSTGGNILVKNNVYFISFFSIVYNLQDPKEKKKEKRKKKKKIVF